MSEEHSTPMQADPRVQAQADRDRIEAGLKSEMWRRNLDAARVMRAEILAARATDQGGETEPAKPDDTEGSLSWEHRLKAARQRRAARMTGSTVPEFAVEDENRADPVAAGPALPRLRLVVPIAAEGLASNATTGSLPLARRPGRITGWVLALALALAVALGLWLVFAPALRPPEEPSLATVLQQLIASAPPGTVLQLPAGAAAGAVGEMDLLLPGTGGDGQTIIRYYDPADQQAAQALAMALGGSAVSGPAEATGN